MSSARTPHDDPARRAMLLTALYLAEEQYGYLSPEAIQRVADRLYLRPKQVLETASFYSMYHFEPHGRYVIQICEGLSCHLAGGAEDLAAHLSEQLGIPLGATTTDDLFTLQTVQCLAACGTSPAMRINDTLYDHLTFDQVDLILATLKGGA